jgi:hypothetical protein
MAPKISAETLQAMVTAYEQALRILVSKADDDESLFFYLTSPSRTAEITLYEVGRYETFREVRRIAAGALSEFRSDIRVA